MPKKIALHIQDKTIQLARQLVRIPSITNIHQNDKGASHDALALLAEYAEKTGAAVTWHTFKGGHSKWDYPVENIVIDWTFGNADKHLCYMGHVDVVPTGDEQEWSKDPFSGDISDGFLHGRGTTDMKGSVVAFLTAIEEGIKDLSKQNIRISMIITADEEWAAVNGSVKVLQDMKSKGIHPDAFIVGEPSSQDTLGSHIKIGRRGSLCGTLNVAGIQGHAAYQGLFKNPNRALALATSILNSHAWKDGNKNFPNTNFEAIATQSGDFNASAVVPAKATLLWNIRYTPDHTPDSLEKWIKDVLKNPPAWAKKHPDFKLLKDIAIVANKDTASLPYYSAPATLARSAKAAIQKILKMNAQYDGSGGTTDGRFAAKIFPSAEIIELGNPERGGMPKSKRPSDYLQKGGMHQVDERISTQDLINLRRIFAQTVKNYAQMNTKKGTLHAKPKI